MIKNYEDSIAYLQANGWRKIYAGSLSKSGLEIVFDTTHYVERYDESSTRIAETEIKSLSDMIDFSKKNNLN